MAGIVEKEERFAVDCIMCRRMLDEEEQFLVRWEGEFEPTWEKGETLRSDCPEVVKEYLEASLVLKVLKGIVRPSSPELNWKTVSGLLAFSCTQTQWKPTQGKWKSRHQEYPCLNVVWMERYFKFVDAAANEMGKMPVLCDILVQGLKLYPNKVGKKLEIIPFGKVLNNYCTDYLVAVVEVSGDGKRIISLVLYGLKQHIIAAHLASVSENYLAQAMVEAYYALLACDVDHPSIVVALTDVGTTHYFQLKLPITRNSGSSSSSSSSSRSRKLELVWYEKVMLRDYPPQKKEDLFEFIEFFHFVLDQLL